MWFVYVAFCAFAEAQKNSVVYNATSRHLWIRGWDEFFPLQEFEKQNIAAKFSNIISIGLENLAFNPEDLLLSLENCLGLESITLRHVQWTGGLPFKIKLPKLHKLEISKANWIFADSSRSEILSFIFKQDWETDPDFEITLSDSSLGKFYFAKEQLEISNDPFGISTCFPFARSYRVKKSVLNISEFHPSNVYKFTGEDLNLINGDMNALIAKLGQAESLQLQRYTLETKEYVIDLAYLPRRSYSELMLNGYDIICSTSFEFDKVTTLILGNTFANLSLLSFANSYSVEKLCMLANVNFLGDTNFETVFATQTNISYVLMVRFKHKFSELLCANQNISSLDLQFIAMQSLKTCELRNVKELSLGNCKWNLNFVQNFQSIFTNLETLSIFSQMDDALFNEIITHPTLEKLNIVDRSSLNSKRMENFVATLGVPAYAEFIRLARNNTTWKLPNEHNLEFWSRNALFRDIYLHLYTFSIIFICTIGLIGNFISAVILIQKSMKSSTATILLGLALCDSLVVISYASSAFYFGIKFVLVFNEFVIMKYHVRLLWFKIGLFTNLPKWAWFNNQFDYPLGKTAYMGSVFMTAFLTVERYMAVCHPLKVRSLLSICTVTTIVMALTVISIIFNIPRWWEASTSAFEITASGLNGNFVDEDDSFPMTWEMQRIPKVGSILNQRWYRLYYHGWLWIILMYGIPIPLLCYLNYKICQKLKQAQVRRLDLLPVPYQSHDALRQTNNSTPRDESTSGIQRMLFVLVSIFLVCNVLNGCITWFMISRGKYNPMDVEVFSAIPIIINSSINFVIYMWSGNKFRVEFFNVCNKIWFGLREQICKVHQLTLRIFRR